MQILNSKGPDTNGNHLVLMFGLGMIGSAIRNALFDFEYKLAEKIDFDWQDSERRHKSLSRIDRICVSNSQPSTRISIVWSAGKSTFQSSQDEVFQENTSFLEIVDFAINLKNSLQLASFDFHFIGSAGGLFEGQRGVDDKSVPSPLRPYGRLKLAQEQLLKGSFSKKQLVIYRPSSVYGPMVLKSQQGLINNLVSNGRKRRETVLDSHVMALRDYVFAGDIGKYIARRVCHGNAESCESSINFLVSSRCTSIFEVVQKVQKVLNLKLKYRYDQSFGNNSNITFSDHVLPIGWFPSTLDVGLRQFLL